MKLEIKNLHVSVEGNEILKGVNLVVNQGEIHAVMGPNGSGKTSLAFTIMGHPKYKVTQGEILFDGHNVLEMSADKRAKLGLFLGFQYPTEISGVTLSNFLRTAYRSLHNGMSVLEFKEFLQEKLQQLHMDSAFAQRYLNEGFSGGEKKRCEVLQMAVLQPKIAVLDETDSGTDIDALRIISEGINLAKGNKTGILLITHYNRILNHVKPDFVHVMVNGKIVKTGDATLANEVEETGYKNF